MLVVLLYMETSLVGGFNHLENYDFVSWEYDIPNIWKYKYNAPNHQTGMK